METEQVTVETLQACLHRIRGEAIELQRRGFTGREASALRWEAVKLSTEIEQLENALTDRSVTGTRAAKRAI